MILIWVGGRRAGSSLAEGTFGLKSSVVCVIFKGVEYRIDVVDPVLSKVKS